MSQSSGGAHLTDYRAALSVPGSRGPVVASLFARLPIAMIGISALLYVQRQTGSFTTAGLVSACTLAGVSVGSVAQGRLIDRYGPTRPLLAVAALFTLLLAALVVAIESHASTPVLAVTAAGIGVSEPMTGSASRALWARLLPPGPTRDAALSYEAISMEVFFILGPGLAGALIAAPWPGTGLVIGGACMVVGSVLFALSPAVRTWGPGEERPSRLLGALASPGLRTLALAAGGFGMVIGFVEVAVPAAASAAGSVAMGGLLLSLWSVSSVGFGVAYNTRPWPRSLHLRLPVLLALFGAGVALLAVPSSLWGLGAALLVAGALITAQSTAHSVAIELVAPRGTAAEAFGWVVTAITLGLAFGQSMSGYLVERSGPPLAFLTAAACAGVVAGAVWLLRSTIGPTEPYQRRTERVAC
ncbi:MFS transporter [Saccharomonospora marina]|uniref:MFS transporter n=1 Tax=Saccharomonospora marina TaxID=632569 RepID=UPI000592A661|nr:MFS transporter [Saccharomonospora marina]